MSERFTTRDLALAALFAALTSVGALFSIPFLGPIPFTLQVLFVLLAGLVLGMRLAAMSMLTYIALGLIAPVYAGGASGFGTLFGPPGGYIWGFLVGAMLVGYLAERLDSRTVPRLTAVAAAGLVPIYALGATWLAISVGAFNVHVVVWGGVLQFLPADLLKAFVAALTVRALASARVRLPVAAIREDRLARLAGPTVSGRDAARTNH